MNFKENKAIYWQVADRLCDEILLDKYKEDERVPSVREYAAIVEVNFNTVMRSFEYLQSVEIIYNKRGVGYFVSKDAKKRIEKQRTKVFLKEDVNDFFRQIYTLNIPIEEIVEMYKEYSKNQ
ncbi:MAG: GntR family transcriptional regulator [Dysgonomonas sp.]|nr:GntR family transcriptional regulator [Dysgonomonas sp.]